MTNCPECGRKPWYSYDWDAYFCVECNVWLEEKCDDPSCEYCQQRPAYPMDKEAT